MYKMTNFRFVLFHENLTLLFMKVMIYGVRHKRQEFRALQPKNLV